ncbi:hypothetical protein J2783_002376 [Chryseobacterium sediminis]|nr:hypothetical protein [Chryseobacterium sediminis]
MFFNNHSDNRFFPYDAVTQIMYTKTADFEPLLFVQYY